MGQILDQTWGYRSMKMMRMRKIGLTGKLAGGFTAVLLITLAVGAIGVVVAGRMNTQTQRLSDQIAPGLSLIGDFYREGNAHRRAAQQFVLTNDPTVWASHERRIAESDAAMTGFLAKYEKFVLSESEKTVFDAVKLGWTTYASETPRILALHREGRTEEARADLNGWSLQLFAQVESELKFLADLRKTEATQVGHAADLLAVGSRRLLVGSSLVGVVFGLLLTVIFSRSIGGPALALAGAARVVASGDLTVPPLPVRSGDEIGDLTRAFNQMRATLHSAVDQIAGASRQVAQTGEQLTATSNMAARATSEISATIATLVTDVERTSGNQEKNVREAVAVVEQLDLAIQQIAKGSQDQARSVTQTSSLLGQVAMAVQQVAATAQNLAAASTQTSAAAEKGSQSVRKTIAGMKRIRETVTASSAKIKEMDDYSQQIGQIVDVISEIAGQTNLLALNAAIEAARAGEHGKGFAVVADAVRSLAERSSRATKEIGALINTIRQGTESAVQAMETGTRDVLEGSALAQEAGAALDEILRTVNDTNLQVHHITAATQQIAASSTEAVRAMDSVASVTEESTAATQQMAAGSSGVRDAVTAIETLDTQSLFEVTSYSEEVSASVEQVASSATQLSMMASELQKVVARFKL
jgi:methyl-accepting chemotaxis protein